MMCAPLFNHKSRTVGITKSKRKFGGIEKEGGIIIYFIN